jgi:hypothetical protein
MSYDTAAYNHIISTAGNACKALNTCGSPGIVERCHTLTPQLSTAAELSLLQPQTRTYTLPTAPACLPGNDKKRPAMVDGMHRSAAAAAGATV